MELIITPLNIKKVRSYPIMGSPKNSNFFEDTVEVSRNLLKGLETFDSDDEFADVVLAFITSSSKSQLL